METKTAMISGHLDLTASEFKAYYQGLIDYAILQGHRFVVGDAGGTDKRSQEYLANKGLTVTVFHMFDTPRNNLAGFPMQGGFQTDDERDAAMTAASDYDIAWVRPGRENSGTARNIARRKSDQ